jgi:hypothetical protein
MPLQAARPEGDGHEKWRRAASRHIRNFSLKPPFIMIRSSLILLGLIAAASAVPIVPQPISDAPLFNTSSGYNPGAAVAYAKSNCNSGQGLCAEFASRSMAAGGAGNPVITWVPDLVNVRPCCAMPVAYWARNLCFICSG